MSKSTLQTLDRGLQALDVIGGRGGGIAIAELAGALDVHRTIAYRIVATLEAHGLVARKEDGQIYLGVGLLRLASGFQPHLRARAQPLLDDLANATAATAFISLAEGDDCAALMEAEPDSGVLRVGYRVGSRHPLTIGAAGIAILAGRPARADDSDAVIEARAAGYSVSRGELQAGAVGVASPIFSGARHRPDFEASVGVVALADLDIERSRRAVTSCAAELARLLRE